MTEKMPGGATPSDRDDPLPINATTEDPVGYILAHPEMSGISVQVQHPNSAGRPARELGVAGIGIAQTPIGPIVMLQLIHADGTSLSGMLTVDDFASFTDLITEAGKRVMLIGASEAGSVQ